MNVIKAKFDVEVTIHFDEDGKLIVEVFHGKDEEPIATSSFSMYSMVKEFYECVSHPNSAKISDCDAVEMSYDIIDEMQDCIDFLNDVIEDPDDSID